MEETEADMAVADPRKSFKHLMGLTTLEEFQNLVKETGLLSMSPRDVVREAMTIAAPVSHLSSYEAHIPYGYLFFMSGFDAVDYLPAPHKNLGLAQALWFEGEEEKSAPYLFCEEKLSNPDLAAAIEKNSFPALMDAMKHACSSAKGLALAEQLLLKRAYHDIANLGFKLFFVEKAFEIIRKIEFPDPCLVLFPVLHYYFYGPHDTEYAKLVETRLAPLGKEEVQIFLKNAGVPDEAEQKRLEKIVLYQYPALIIENFVYALKQGVRAEHLFEIVLQAASRLIIAAFRENAAFPVHAFLNTYAAWEAFHRIADPADRLYLPFVAALITNKMVSKSLDAHKIIQWEALHVPEAELNTQTLAHAIASSEPDLAAAVMSALLQHKPGKDILETLTLQASKNDGGVALGLDLSFAVHASRCFERSVLPGKEKYLIAAAYYLAQLEKDYDLSNLLLARA